MKISDSHQETENQKKKFINENRRTMPWIGPQRKKPCLREFVNNEDADQPAHPRSLVSAFVIRLLESIISRLPTSENSIFYLVSIPEQVDLRPRRQSETSKTGFLATRAQL